jgi:hypothetical protein
VVDQPDRAVARQLRPDAHLAPPCLDVQAQRGQAVPETAVDRLLGGPERGDRLLAITHVAELGLHHPPEKPTPAVRREDPHDRHSRARHSTGGKGQLERVGPGAGDDLAVVEDGDHPVERKDLREPLRVLGRRLPAEVVSDRAERADELVMVSDGAHAEGHPAILVGRRAADPPRGTDPSGQCPSFSSGA